MPSPYTAPSTHLFHFYQKPVHRHFLAIPKPLSYLTPRPMIVLRLALPKEPYWNGLSFPTSHKCLLQRNFHPIQNPTPAAYSWLFWLFRFQNRRFPNEPPIPERARRGNHSEAGPSLPW